MARQRDYAAEYARRQARARALGFESYYERRTRRRPGAPKPPAEELARRRGHRGRADFLGSLREGDLILCDITGVTISQSGRYGPIWKTVIPGDGGVEREYVLRNQTRASLLAAILEEERRGVIFSPSPSMDQRRLLSARETEGGY